MKVALYARYSSDSQRDASIADQLRACRSHADKQGWQIVEEYTDHAVSGASLLRPGIQALITDASRGRFQIVLAEAMDRLSRDQEDIAGLFKRMAFGSVKIVTLSEGEVSQLHVGLKGTMNALFLKDLADKTRRGLVGRVKDGKSGGGLCFGYDVVRRMDADGDPMRGERTINETEAAVVRRIFRSYSEGKSSRTIALELNREGVAGPQGGEWGPSTIHGNPTRGTGIINNELYVGRLVWNRLRYLKDPGTGKRVSRLNPEEEWVIQDVPELRIIDQDSWDAAKERQRSLALTPTVAGNNGLNDRRRPKHLFSGLVWRDNQDRNSRQSGVLPHFWCNRLGGREPTAIHAAINTRCFRRWYVARPYIWRLMALTRLIWPSTGLVVHGSVIAARTASMSRLMPFAKVLSSLASAATNH